MILDKGIMTLMRIPENHGKDGNMASGELEQYHICWYGERTVGMSRFYSAQQANTNIDKVVRIRYTPGLDVRADDVAVLKDKSRYRVAQAQYLQDDESGMNVIDISLERVGYRDGNN